MGKMGLLRLLATTLQCSLLVAAAPSSQSLPVGGPIDTSSGTILGTTADKTNGISAYLGIPFAQPPINNLRWAAPLKYTSKETINATTWPVDCAATLFSSDLAAGLNDIPDTGALLLLTSLMQLGNTLSEDCLRLNVWTKRSSVKKPVMVWIYVSQR